MTATVGPKPDPVLLEVRGLVMEFGGSGIRRKSAGVRAVDGVDLDVHRSETVALVGESGCGKSTLARCILRVYKPQRGSVKLNGREVLTARGNELRRMRKDMTVILQDPTSSMDPRMRVRDVIGEPLIAHRYGTAEQRKARVRELLDVVGLDPQMADRYPHEFSGGQRQRVAIARALALEPSLIICDESVAALDVSIRAQVINLLADLQESTGVSYLFISHDLSVAYHISDRIAVMYLGRIVEIGDAAEVLDRPYHPYTRLLLDAVPTPNPEVEADKRGLTPEADREPVKSVTKMSGCSFRNRCFLATDACAEVVPPLLEVQPGHWAACIHAERPLLRAEDPVPASA